MATVYFSLIQEHKIQNSSWVVYFRRFSKKRLYKTWKRWKLGYLLGWKI